MSHLENTIPLTPYIKFKLSLNKPSGPNSIRLCNNCIENAFICIQMNQENTKTTNHHYSRGI